MHAHSALYETEEILMRAAIVICHMIEEMHGTSRSDADAACLAA